MVRYRELAARIRGAAILLRERFAPDQLNISNSKKSWKNKFGQKWLKRPKFCIHRSFTTWYKSDPQEARILGYLRNKYCTNTSLSLNLLLSISFLIIQILTVEKLTRKWKWRFGFAQSVGFLSKWRILMLKVVAVSKWRVLLFFQEKPWNHFFLESIATAKKTCFIKLVSLFAILTKEQYLRSLKGRAWKNVLF